MLNLEGINYLNNDKHTQQTLAHGTNACQISLPLFTPPKQEPIHKQKGREGGARNQKQN